MDLRLLAPAGVSLLQEPLSQERDENLRNINNLYDSNHRIRMKNDISLIQASVDENSAHTSTSNMNYSITVADNLSLHAHIHWWLKIPLQCFHFIYQSQCITSSKSCNIVANAKMPIQKSLQSFWSPIDIASVTVTSALPTSDHKPCSTNLHQRWHMLHIQQALLHKHWQLHLSTFNTAILFLKRKHSMTSSWILLLKKLYRSSSVTFLPLFVTLKWHQHWIQESQQ